ncbi:MAG: aminotransferase class I/II-fold pyridoxal phosphate-dependent enzyme [Candidatus Methylarchaceae archaeon HK02M1]|nr:aminotransferase class I/II-fold pyridoxal phosphate-dependent enzyme [Candidatus Methylarchaceae archaeon HK02M1]
MYNQTKELNEIIKKTNPTIYNLLSEKGRTIFFPKRGILAQTSEAKGKKINATIGQAIEDDGTPMRLPSISKNVLLDPEDVFSYAPSYGKPELRKVWKKLIRKKNPSLKGNISLPIVTNGITEGLSTAAYLFVNPGEKIILTDLYWGNYKLIFQNGFNSKLDTYNTFKEGGFDTESFHKKILEEKGKKIILFNFPNNPTGYTPTKRDVNEIIKIIKENAELGNEILAICDDAYFGLVYEKGIYEESLFSKFANLHENILSIKLDGITKEDYAWGLRVGFITYSIKGIGEVTYQALESKTAGVIRGSISNVSNLSQSLALKAFSSPTYELEKKEKYELLKARFERVQEVLKNSKYSKYFSPFPYNSGYFMCIKLKMSLDAERVRKTLLEKYDTGVIALKNLLRIAYSSLAENEIEQLFENIYHACSHLQQ